MDLHRPRVLVVDDDPSARGLLAYLLTNAGYLTFEASDGVDALEALLVRRFDLLITDYQMPRLNGLHLLAVSRKICPGLPVLVVSADATLESDCVIGRQAYAWVRKPYTCAEILKIAHVAIQHPYGLAPSEHPAFHA